MATAAGIEPPLPLLGGNSIELPPQPGTKGKKAQLSATWHLASGAVSGAASVLALQPLDRASGWRLSLRVILMQLSSSRL